ncbi:hypothetical protein [Tenacibaculum sp. SZ-18]|uniref:hypothetical protein n=1 Tax=Tenacibaculum sp. SZ-18 TaxID=754423 RepID=UPI0012FE7778|nr:hypothetical protein [Tenacibaculum sp. SZ-18]
MKSIFIEVMKKNILFIFLSLLISCTKKSKGTPDELIHLNYNTSKGKQSILVNPSQTKNCDIIEHNGIEFLICYNTKSEKKIDYIFVKDKKYSTSENIKIGSTYEDIMKINPKAEIINIDGWAKVIYLPSKWIACFNYNENVKNTSEVSYLYYWRQDMLTVKSVE